LQGWFQAKLWLKVGQDCDVKEGWRGGGKRGENEAEREGKERALGEERTHIYRSKRPYQQGTLLDISTQDL